MQELQVFLKGIHEVIKCASRLAAIHQTVSSVSYSFSSFQAHKRCVLSHVQNYRNGCRASNCDKLCSYIVRFVNTYVLRCFHIIPLYFVKSGKSFLLRVTPPTCTVSGANRFNGIMQAALRSMMGGTLDADIYWELQLPINIKRYRFISSTVLGCRSPFGFTHVNMSTHQPHDSRFYSSNQPGND